MLKFLSDGEDPELVVSVTAIEDTLPHRLRAAFQDILVARAGAYVVNHRGPTGDVDRYSVALEGCRLAVPIDQNTFTPHKGLDQEVVRDFSRRIRHFEAHIINKIMLVFILDFFGIIFFALNPFLKSSAELNLATELLDTDFCITSFSHVGQSVLSINDGISP